MSDRLYTLKHNFDSLLNVYADFNVKTDEIAQELGGNFYTNKERIQSNTDTVKKAVARKSLIGRIKDAIYNKNNSSTTEINHKENTVISDQNTNKITAKNKESYLLKLRLLQQRNVKLLDMQRELIDLNNRINNEMESIISNIKDINHNMSIEFKNMALKNYRETTVLLNRFYMAQLFLVVGFALSLIIFIIKLNRSELLLRKENEESIEISHQKIEQLILELRSNNNGQGASKIEELEEIVHLVMNNNPAFLVKFNEFDPEFVKELLRISPALIVSEIEFCILLRLNFERKKLHVILKLL